MGSHGPLSGPVLAVLECSGAYLGGLGPLSGPMLAVLGRSRRLCWRSWAALGAYVRRLLLGPMLAVLGRSWGLCWRSWGVLGPKWSVLGRDQAEIWPKPEREGDQARNRTVLAPSTARGILRIFSIDIIYWIIRLRFTRPRIYSLGTPPIYVNSPLGLRPPGPPRLTVISNRNPQD